MTEIEKTYSGKPLRIYIAGLMFYIFVYNFDIIIIANVNITMFRCYLTAIVAYLLLL